MTTRDKAGTPRRVLDLFCGAGGAAMGLHRAWPEAEIVGVDIKPQPRYPFKFILGDAMAFPLEGFDFAWASPPCQKYSATAVWHGREHPDCLPGTRQRLMASRLAWVIENVVGAPMRSDFLLCGSHFGQPRMRRHRLFEVSWNGPHISPQCQHSKEVAITICGHGGRAAGKFHNSPSVWREVMGIPWMNRHELSEAIPPAYSQYIAEQFTKEANRG